MASFILFKPRLKVSIRDLSLHPVCCSSSDFPLPHLHSAWAEGEMVINLCQAYTVSLDSFSTNIRHCLSLVDTVMIEYYKRWRAGIISWEDQRRWCLSGGVVASDLVEDFGRCGFPRQDGRHWISVLHMTDDVSNKENKKGLIESDINRSRGLRSEVWFTVQGQRLGRQAQVQMHTKHKLIVFQRGKTEARSGHDLA